MPMTTLIFFFRHLYFQLPSRLTIQVRFFFYALVNLSKISKYFNFLCFRCYLGHYQPHVVYPQFYQTYPAAFERQIIEQTIESHQRNVCKNNNGEVVPCHKSFIENVDQSRITPGISNVFKSMNEKIQQIAKLPAFKRPVNPIFYSISQDNEEKFSARGKFFS